MSLCLRDGGPLEFNGFWKKTTLFRIQLLVSLQETLEEFRFQYDGKKPILRTELAEEWPARNKWTKEQLLFSYGDVGFRISQRSSKKITMKFNDYVSYMELQHDEVPRYIFYYKEDFLCLRS